MNRLALAFLQEVRSPLSAAISSLGMLADLLPAPSNPAVSRLLDNARASLTVLHRRTEDAQEIMHFRSGLARTYKQPFSVADLLKNVVQELRDDARSAGVRLDLGVQPDLPRLRGDQRHIEHVLRYFVRSALDSAAEGRRIDVRALRRNGSILLEVQDSARGDELAAGDGGGTGVGLELCRILVHQHGGKLTAACEPERGCLFSAEIPVT